MRWSQGKSPRGVIMYASGSYLGEWYGWWDGQGVGIPSQRQFRGPGRKETTDWEQFSLVGVDSVKCVGARC